MNVATDNVEDETNHEEETETGSSCVSAVSKTATMRRREMAETARLLAQSTTLRSAAASLAAAKSGVIYRFSF